MNTSVSDMAAVQRVQQPPSIGWVLAALALCMLLPSLGTSIANVALPTLVEKFNAPFQQVQWVVLAYLLATTTLIVSAGRLGDITGRRRLLLAGLFVFIAASSLAGFAPSLGWLIAARALQGLGAAVLMALSLALVGEVVPRTKTGSAMGLLGTMSAVGTALGPSLGGVLIATFGWQSIFFVNVPLGALAIVLAFRHLPADGRVAEAQQRRFDHLGTLLLALTLAAYALAMTIGRGSFGRLNVALLLAAAVGGALFARVEARAASPLIPLARFRDRALSARLATSALVSTVMMATLVVGPFYLARAIGLDTALVGIVLSAGPVVAAAAGVPAGKMVDRLGAQRMTAAGLAGMVVGCVALSAAPTAFGVAGYLVPIVIVTASYALFQAANNTAVLTNVAQAERGSISGMLNLARNLGLVTGASAMGAVFAVAAQAADLATAAPAAVAFGMRVTFAVAAALVVVALTIALWSRSFTSRARRSAA